MATTRRSTRTSETTKSRATSVPTYISKPSTIQSPFQPTTLESILLATYPIVLITGSLFAILDPATRHSPYDPTAQAHVASLAPSYFARKDNLFNQLFVKRGWAWVTASYLVFLFTHSSTGPRGSAVLTPRRIQGAVRWGLVTLYWVFVTQWFFGPAIIDRGFTLTGGACDLVEANEKGHIDLSEGQKFVTAVACKAGGGKWAGGHDISGHVFLLVLGSMFLFEEVLHVIMRSGSVKEERTVVTSAGEVKSAETEAPMLEAHATHDWDLGVKFVLSVAALSIWMLLMTAAYFHTWFEKFTGLLVALMGIFVVYFLPRAVPAYRALIGLPGL